MKLRTLLPTLVVAAVAPLSLAQEFPAGTITVVVPYGPGGGFDTATRAIAPYMEEALGPDTDLVIENISGAGGQRGATAVARAEPDGRTFGIFNLPGFVLPEMLGQPVQYDLTELSWIGRLANQDYALLARGSSDIDTLDDLLALNEITVTSHGFGATGLAANQIMFAVLGLEDRDVTYISGYSGTAETVVGAIRGDGDITVSVIGSVADYVESGDLTALAVTGEQSPWDGVPTFAEAGYPELTPINLQRSFAGPPGIPEDRLEILRNAFLEAVNNEDFLADAERQGMEVVPLGGAEAGEQVNTSYDLYNRYRESLANPNQ